MGKGPPTLSSGNASSIPARGSYKRAWGGGHGGGVIDIYTWPWSYDHRGGGGGGRAVRVRVVGESVSHFILARRPVDSVRRSVGRSVGKLIRE